MMTSYDIIQQLPIVVEGLAHTLLAHDMTSTVCVCKQLQIVHFILYTVYGVYGVCTSYLAKTSAHIITGCM